MDPKSLPLTDEQLSALSPALLTLVATLEDIAEREPSPSTSNLAFALARYFRTPD